MTPPPPPPAYPPTIGHATEQQPVLEWWRKSWPAKQNGPTTEPVDPRKDDTDRQAEASPQPDQPPFDWNAFAHRMGHTIGEMITETSEEREARIRADREARYAAEGETEAERKARHRREAADRRRKASALWRQDGTRRAQRFRRWCTLTALSASAGYSIGLVQWLGSLPYHVTIAALGGAYCLDVWLRGGWVSAVRITDLRGVRPLAAVTLTRVPFGSALAASLHLAPLLSATGQLLHH
ncbi:hypothetical protein ACGF07_25580 [Kitasatospora sp. NPDC048194]|uniref:hypothetical protein n=1 Tax=Kitasatospora sp. NPDC048194 TaxID=3364045 RepID=UPI003714AD53